VNKNLNVIKPTLRIRIKSSVLTDYTIAIEVLIQLVNTTTYAHVLLAGQTSREVIDRSCMELQPRPAKTGRDGLTTTVERPPN
jgi:hypothetical protein